MSREIMQQAFDAMNDLEGYRPNIDKAMLALHQALAQPEQEPVGWFIYVVDSDTWVQDYSNMIGQPLYTAPPKREWVGLTGREIELVLLMSGYTAENFARAIEAKLKEKNYGSV